MTQICLVALAVLCQAKPDPKKPPAVDPVKVDQAIKKGTAYLKSMIGKYGSINTRRSEELILWTLVHAGVPETDPDFQKLFKLILETPIEWTYNVSLQAMILEELDRVKYQARIAHCAQFLVDNQCKNGQWSYGSPTLFSPDVPSGAPRDVASGGARKVGGDPNAPVVERKKPKVVRRIPVKKMREGPAVGDNSNSQYASLGLRACHDAGIVLPADVVQAAEKWWREAATDEQAGGYGVEGWSYGKKGSGESYGSMTAGAVGGILIFDYIQNRPWMKDKDAVAGLEWLARNFSVTENPKMAAGEGQGGWHYYFLYALERAGIFYGTETLGGHTWYVEGAKFLLGAQQADGSWLSKGADHGIWDTCFAVLFLRRATRPLVDVASVDRVKK